MIYWVNNVKLFYAPSPFWSILEQNGLKMMVVYVKYIILKKIKILLQRPCKIKNVEKYQVYIYLSSSLPNRIKLAHVHETYVDVDCCTLISYYTKQDILVNGSNENKLLLYQISAPIS